MLHMTMSFYDRGTDTYAVTCRCGWHTAHLPTQQSAVEHGDNHLIEEYADGR